MILLVSLLKLHVGIFGFQFPMREDKWLWQVDELGPYRVDLESHEKVATVCTR